MTKVSDDLIMRRAVNSLELDPSLDALPMMSRDDFTRLMDSVSKDGITHPLHVREDGRRVIVLDGRSRLKVATILGLETVPCITVKTDNPIESALGSTINRRRLSKTGIAFFVIQANPEIRNRLGKRGPMGQADKGDPIVHKMLSAQDKGMSLRDLAEKYSLHVSYFTQVSAAIETCRPGSKDEDFLLKLIVDDEVCAANLMKALQGWQASHPVGDDADPASGDVAKKAPVDVVKGLARSMTFIRNQAENLHALSQQDRVFVMEQWHRTWALLPKELQNYAIKKGVTKDYEEARQHEAELAKPARNG